MAVSRKKLALIINNYMACVCVEREKVRAGQGLLPMSVSLCYLQQPKPSPKQIRKPHMMMSQRAHLNDEELVCLRLVFAI